MSPVLFLRRPASWLQLLAAEYPTLSAAPNFAFELAMRRTSDDDMIGRDLGNVIGLINGSERVQAGTVRRFTERFGDSNLKQTAVRPSYGLAEATLYVATPTVATPPRAVSFDNGELAAGRAKSLRTRASTRPSWSITVRRGHRWCGSSIPTRARNAPKA